MNSAIFYFLQTTGRRPILVVSYSNTVEYNLNNSCTISALLENCAAFNSLCGSQCWSQDAESLTE